MLNEYALNACWSQEVFFFNYLCFLNQHALEVHNEVVSK